MVNIAVCAGGVLCCIVSGIVSAPAGILDNDSANLISVMPVQYLGFLYIVPVLLMLVAFVLVVLGRFDIPTLATALCGAILFAAEDIRLIVDNQVYVGVLINMIGIILVVSGVALQVLATETGPAKLTRKAAKKRNSVEVPYERHHRPSYDDIYADTSEEFNELNHREEEAFTKSLKPAETSDSEVVFSDTEFTDIEEKVAKTTNQEKEDEDILQKLLMVMSLSESEGYEKHEAEQSGKNERWESKNSGNGGYDISDIAETTTSSDIEDPDDISEALISLLEEDGANSPYEENALANMAAALETPDSVMADFYDGIEDIFLNN